MVSIYKRGRVWWIRIHRKGLAERRSLRTRNRATAEALRDVIEKDVLSGGRLRQKPWEEFVSEFKASIASEVRPRTQENYSSIADKLTDHLKERGLLFLSEVTPAVITDFIDRRRRELHPSWKRAMTEGGVRFYLRALHRIFAYAVEREYIPKNPVIAKNRNAIAGRTRPFSQEEITTMLTSPYLDDKSYLRAIVLLFLHSGLRIGDVINLRKANVEGANLVLRARKNNQVIRLPIHPELREALLTQEPRQTVKQRESLFFFSTSTGAPIVGLDKHLRRLWKACHIHGAHAHRFRDTFAVRLLESGATLYDVAKLLGISAVVVEAHYAPYVKELQERGRRFVSMLNYTTAQPDIFSDPESERPAPQTAWKN
jgi:integrase/recombinase XerD